MNKSPYNYLISMRISAAKSLLVNIFESAGEVDGKTYTYYEARYTAGFDSGTYIAPCKMTVAEWLDVWASQYLGGVKESTIAVYNATIRTHIRPSMGAIPMEACVKGILER